MLFKALCEGRLLSRPFRTKTCLPVRRALLIMKFTAMLLLVACLTASAKGFSQRITIDAKDVPIEKVFREIKKQSGYTFVYRDEWLQLAQKVNVQLKEVSIAEALEACFKDQPLTYSIVQTTIVVKLKSPVPGKEQQELIPPIDVHGRVVNEKGEPVIATIMVKGTKHAVGTNENGEFTIKNIDANAVLVISATTIESFEVKVNDRTELNVSATTRVSPMDEVQVQAYGTVTKRYNISSISTVKAEDIAAQPVTNVLQALEGRVPGLVVSQTSGLPGASVLVQIRGQNSLNPTPSGIMPRDNPLYIIDGMPFSPPPAINQYGSLAAAQGFIFNNPYGGISPFSLLNPSDIESIEILRDAAATAIYGSRGANGVILITTKKGKPGTTKFNATVSTAESHIGHTMPMMNTQQYLEMRREALANDGLTPNLLPYDPANSPDLLVFDTTKNTDWKDYLVGGSAHTTDVNVSVSGGSATTQFFLSGSYHHETYIYPGDYAYKRGSVNTNFHHNSANKKLSVDFSAQYSYDKNNSSNNPNLLYAFTIPPNFPDLLNPDGSINWNYKGVHLGSYSDVNSFTSPMEYLKQPYAIKNYNLISNAQIAYQLVKGLTVRSSFGYNTLNSSEYVANPNVSRDPINGVFRSANFGANNLQSWRIEPQAEYKGVVAKGKLNVLLGATFLQNANNKSDIRGENYNNDQLLNSITGAGITGASGTSSLYKYTGVFGRINYIRNSKYIIDLTGRRDGSSRFGPNRQFGNFWSAGAGWLFTEEAFMQRALPVFSYGKLRFSYGTSGNDNIGDYQFLPLYTPLADFSYQGIPGYLPRSLYNPDFSWGVNKKLEVGLDVGLFKDRLLGTISWYRNRSDNQLIRYTLPSQVGFGDVLQNAPYTVQNAGLEITLSSVNIKNASFTWSTSFTLSIPENKLLSFPGIVTSPYRTAYVVGQSLTVLQKVRFLGVNDTTGIFQFLTAKGVPTYNPNTAPLSLGGDEVIIGNQDQKYYGGLQNNISYKGFQLGFFFQFVKQYGPTYLQQVYSLTKQIGGIGNLPASFSDRWQKPGDHSAIQKFSTQYGAAYSGADYFVNYSEGSYGDASFIRLKTVALSYNLPQQWLKRISAEGCKIYVSAQNLFTITGYEGNDPENQSFYSIPPLRTIAAGIQFSF